MTPAAARLGGPSLAGRSSTDRPIWKFYWFVTTAPHVSGPPCSLVQNAPTVGGLCEDSDACICMTRRGSGPASLRNERSWQARSAPYPSGVPKHLVVPPRRDTARPTKQRAVRLWSSTWRQVLRRAIPRKSDMGASGWKSGVMIGTTIPKYWAAGARVSEPL